MKKPVLVEIHWTDARSIYDRISWSDIIGRCKLAKQVTVGYLVDRDDERTIVAHTYDPCDGSEEPDGVDITCIPTGWIDSLKTFSSDERRASWKRHAVKKSDKAREILTWLREQPCRDCQLLDSESIEFDHARGEKRLDITNLGQVGKRKWQEELKKCDAVCANCHAKRTRRRRKEARLESKDGPS